MNHSTPAPKFSVCIASVRADTVGATITSIQRQTQENWELIVVGQGADDAPVRSVVEQAAVTDSRIRYLHIGSRGLSRARNVGLRAAVGEIIAMTDDDCEADPNWLDVIAQRLDGDNTIGVVGGSLVVPPTDRRGFSSCPGVEPHEAVYDPFVHERRAPSGWDWIGGNVAIRRSVVARVGEFDVHLGAGALFPAGEDTDYKLRLEALGVRMATTPDSIVHHTFGRRNGIRAMLRTSANYARGNAALAAKLTLSGDRRGAEWLAETKRDCLMGCLRRPWRLPRSLHRWHHYSRTYRRCLTTFDVDPATGMLRPIRPA